MGANLISLYILLAAISNSASLILRNYHVLENSGDVDLPEVLQYISVALLLALTLYCCP